MKSDKLLRPRQLTAMQLLVSGTPASQVAEQLEVSVMTIYRWQRLPAFESKLNSLASSGLQEIAKQLNATALTAVEQINEVLCDLSQPTSIRLKAAVAVLGVMGSVNGALERSLQHRVADFALNHQWNNQGGTYDAAGQHSKATVMHTITV